MTPEFFQDLVKELLSKDLVVILSPGLSVHQLIACFLAQYLVSFKGSNPAKCSSFSKETPSGIHNVILVLNMSSDLARCTQQLCEKEFSHVFECVDMATRSRDLGNDQHGISREKIFMYLIEGSMTVSKEERQKLYIQGGVFFISSRVVVTDILTGRLAGELVDGVIVSNAEGLFRSSCNTAFAVRLLKEQWSHVFIKAFSDAPQGFFRGEATLSRVLKALTCAHVLLWPRWHPVVDKWIQTSPEPTTHEVHVSLTELMKKIQTALLSLIAKGYTQLKRHPNVDFSQTCLDACCFQRGWDAQLNHLLQPLWEHLPTHYKRLVHDVAILRQLLCSLTHLDPVAFLNALELFRLSDTIDSCWLLANEWNVIVRATHLRVHGPPHQTLQHGSSGADSTHMETPPKWLALQQTLHHSLRSIEQIPVAPQNSSKQSADLLDVLVVVEDLYLVHQVKQVLRLGIDGAKHSLLRQFSGKLLEKSIDLGLTPTPGPSKRLCRRGTLEKSTESSYRGLRDTSFEKSKEDTSFETLEEDTSFEKSKEDTSFEFQSQSDGVECREGDSLENGRSGSGNDEILVETQSGVLSVKVCCFSTHHDLQMFLTVRTPRAIILWAPYLPFFRILEMYCAERFSRESCGLKPCGVECGVQIFLYVFPGTAEHQGFLYSVEVHWGDGGEGSWTAGVMIKREKRLWKLLEQEKEFSVACFTSSTLSLEEAVKRSREAARARRSTRQGGAYEGSSQPTIVVDVREFQSPLPFHLHMGSLRVIPTTLVVGDYVLSREICVERKTIPDLIASLSCGRLLEQLREMARSYKGFALLLQYQSNKTFSLKSREWNAPLGERPGSSEEVMTRFYILLLHVSGTRLLWSPSHHYTVGLFLALKKNREEPDPLRCSVVASHDTRLVEEIQRERVMELLRYLPHVTHRVAPRLLSSLHCLAALAEMELCTLTAMLGKASGKALYHFLDKRFF